MIVLCVDRRLQKEMEIRIQIVCSRDIALNGPTHICNTQFYYGKIHCTDFNVEDGGILTLEEGHSILFTVHTYRWSYEQKLVLSKFKFKSILKHTFTNNL